MTPTATTEPDTANLTASASTASPSTLANATAFTWNGQEYTIHPLPNSAWLLIGETLDEANGIFRDVAARLLLKTAGENVESLTGQDVLLLLPALPKIWAALLPCQSAIVAAGLRLDEEKVANEMSLGKKAEALRLIAKAENLPAVWREFAGLVTMFHDDTASASASVNREEIAAASRN